MFKNIKRTTITKHAFFEIQKPILVLSSCGGEMKFFASFWKQSITHLFVQIIILRK